MSSAANSASRSQVPKSTASTRSDGVMATSRRGPPSSPQTASTCLRIANASRGDGCMSMDQASGSKCPSQLRYVANPGRALPSRRRRCNTCSKLWRAPSASFSCCSPPTMAVCGTCAAACDRRPAPAAANPPTASRPTAPSVAGGGGEERDHASSSSSRAICASTGSGTKVPAAPSTWKRVSAWRNAWPKRMALSYRARAWLAGIQGRSAFCTSTLTWACAKSWKSGLLLRSRASSAAPLKACECAA
mmetsp:Transcript_4718/g.12990  ORF Transcript_4718/g.12990 Transcript_4718/m.12990 type:complete len:247 (-) Transcript_4718:378-1118(-)